MVHAPWLRPNTGLLLFLTAAWPFETMLLQKRIRRMSELTDEQRDDLAVAIKIIMLRQPIPMLFLYSMEHGAPFFEEGTDIDHWQLHALFYPPLLRK